MFGAVVSESGGEAFLWGALATSAVMLFVARRLERRRR